MREVFIIGSKGIPAKYGGFETFVDQLVTRKKSNRLHYHVACMSQENGEGEYQGARLFYTKVPNIGPAKAVYYDIAALKQVISYIKKNHVERAIVYILACRVGPFIGHYKRQLKKLGATLYVNPDGHEWKRAKWNWLIRKYWKLSEKLMVKHAELLICDSINIEHYIQEDYQKYRPKTTFLAYGADTSFSKLKEDDFKLIHWYQEKGVTKGNYYLVVGRFIPENNYETMLREFMKSKSKKDFVLITNVEHNKFYEALKKTTHFDQDSRIKFVGTVYDKELIKKIRENAFAYFHGHEVGGTNPSLLEALASTDLNLLLKVGFNEEVGKDGALYFTKESGNLAKLIEATEQLTEKEREDLAKKAKQRIQEAYNWEDIIASYEKIFLLEDGAR